MGAAALGGALLGGDQGIGAISAAGGSLMGHDFACALLAGRVRSPERYLRRRFGVPRDWRRAQRRAIRLATALPEG